MERKVTVGSFPSPKTPKTPFKKTVLDTYLLGIRPSVRYQKRNIKG